ncbi:hypothetical protein, partial [Frankia sp. AiPs1]
PARKDGACALRFMVAGLTTPDPPPWAVRAQGPSGRDGRRLAADAVARAASWPAVFVEVPSG